MDGPCVLGERRKFYFIGLLMEEQILTAKSSCFCFRKKGPILPSLNRSESSTRSGRFFQCGESQSKCLLIHTYLFSISSVSVLPGKSRVALHRVIREWESMGNAGMKGHLAAMLDSVELRNR